MDQQDWTERITKELAEIRKAKSDAQSLYYKLRGEGVSHAVALAAVVEFCLEVKLEKGRAP